MQIIAQDPPINLFDAVMAHRETQKMPTIDFKTPLLTIEQGKAWIESIVAADMLFHFEDSPETIIAGATGKPLFTEAQAKDVRARVGELYDMDWTVTGHECPIGYALEADQPEEYAPTIARMEEEYGAFLSVHHLPEVSAEELLMVHGLTDHQRRWLTTFCERWKAVQAREDAAH